MTFSLRLRRRALLLGAAAALSVWAGCASGPLVEDAPTLALPGAFPNHSASAILTAVHGQTQPLRTFASRSRIEVRSPEQQAAVTARLRQSPDSLYGTLSGPFGIRVGQGLVTSDSFYVDYSFGNAYYLGPLHAASRFAPIPPSSADLFASLTGTLAPTAERVWTVTSDSTHYFLSTTVGGIEQRLTVDPALWRVVAATEATRDGELLGVRTFSAFDRVDGYVVPRRVVIEAPQEDTRVTIEHLSVEVNPDALDFPRPDPGRTPVTVVE